MIGVPGDHIKIVKGTVYVNGVALNEPYTVHGPDASRYAAGELPAQDDTLAFADGPNGRRNWPKIR